MKISPEESGDPRLGRFSPKHQLAFLRTLVDSAADAIVAFEPDGTLLFFNQSACDLLGTTRCRMAEPGPHDWFIEGPFGGGRERVERVLLEGSLTFSSSVEDRSGRDVVTEVTARRVDTELGPVIVSVIRDVTERDAAAERLKYLAYHDALTGLANRAAFEEHLSAAIANSKRHGDLLILAYIDLDRFKPINDRCGHDVGDAVLVEVAARLMSSVRAGDLVTRLGGDEFVILLQRAESQDEIPDIAERLLTRLREPVDVCKHNCAIEASIGFSVFDPEADDARSLVVKADVAMYEAKRDTARRWRIYESHLGTHPEHT